MELRDVVNSNSRLRGCWKQGARAVENTHKKHLRARSCRGSIALDACLKHHCP